MKLSYNNKEISFIKISNIRFLCNKTQKLYYTVLIENINKFSTIYAKQYIDIIAVDNNYVITSFMYNMHPNTIFVDNKGSHIFILPIGTFTDLEKGKEIIIIK